MLSRGVPGEALSLSKGEASVSSLLSTLFLLECGHGVRG